MPISVLCPSCDAPVNAPDSAAGKRAKCPKCQEVMILPGSAAEEFDVVVEPAPKPKPRVRVEEDDEDERPSRKSRRRDEADDETVESPKRQSSRRVVAEDDDEEVERPRKKGKGKSKKKAGPPMGLLIGGGVALLLLVAGGAYFAFSGGSSSGGAAKGGGGGAKPINWVAFEAPDGSFSAAFPDGAPSPQTLAELSTATDRQKLEENQAKMREAGFTESGWARQAGDRKYAILVLTIPPIIVQLSKPDQIRDQFTREMTSKAINQVDIDKGNFKGKQALTKEGNKWTVGMAGMAGNNKVIIVVVESTSELKMDDPDAKAFFEKFQWKK